jgi:predicted Zn-dependent protease with MMP-like domain
VSIKRRGAQSRDQPDRRADVPSLPDESLPELSRPEKRYMTFEELVESALDSLPDNVQKLLDNVAVVIEDEPSNEQLRNAGVGPYGSLYGLYEGVSPVIYGADLVPFPNKITLFRLTLERDYPNPDDLAREVQQTVLHEIGHHAGLDHKRLREAGFR